MRQIRDIENGNTGDLCSNNPKYRKIASGTGPFEMDLELNVTGSPLIDELYTVTGHKTKTGGGLVEVASGEFTRVDEYPYRRVKGTLTINGKKLDVAKEEKIFFKLLDSSTVIAKSFPGDDANPGDPYLDADFFLVGNDCNNAPDDEAYLESLDE